jgi:hypothetical protein
MSQTIDVTGLSPAAVSVVESLVELLRSKGARASGSDPARVGREMLEYRDRVKRTLGGSFRELAHDSHRY